MREPTLFARIGWMTFYNGAREERPQGGGSYNRTNIGSERSTSSPSKSISMGLSTGAGRKAITYDASTARQKR